jgi:hypothetical protein
MYFDKDILDAFIAKCHVLGVPAARVLEEFMKDFNK